MKEVADVARNQVPPPLLVSNYAHADTDIKIPKRRMGVPLVCFKILPPTGVNNYKMLVVQVHECIAKSRRCRINRRRGEGPFIPRRCERHCRAVKRPNGPACATAATAAPLGTAVHQPLCATVQCIMATLTHRHTTNIVW